MLCLTESMFVFVDCRYITGWLTVFVKGNRPLGKPKRRRVANIKTTLIGIICKGVN